MDNSKLVLLPVSLEEFAKTIQEIVGSEVQKQLQNLKQDKPMSPAEVCKFFNISRPTLKAWVNSNRLQEYRMGKRIFFKTSEVENSLQSLQKYKRQRA